MSPAGDEAKDEAKFHSLLEFLKSSRGFDFSGYKTSSLYRRVRKRMQDLQIENLSDYSDYLEVHQEEFAALFNTILINVTEFFRDPLSWQYLHRELLPQILSRKGSTQSVRIWSAGCATGEEAYSAAIVLAESMGADAYRDRVKIYATDVDEDALNHARRATYEAKALEPVPVELREKYFERDRDTALEELQTTTEELETANEELQSTVEELQTTNEELQSTNEEMETMNEELQATNEELRSASSESQARIQDLDRVNLLLESVLSGLRLGVVVDENLRVVLWNERAEDLWGLRSGEVVGRPLGELEIGLSVADLERNSRSFLSGDGKPIDLMMDAVNRRGRSIKCRIGYNQCFLGPEGQNRGAVLLMEEIPQ